MALYQAGVRQPHGYTGPENVTSSNELFVGYLLLDALIVNTDRHHANWAVITSPDEDGKVLVELAPTVSLILCRVRIAS